MTDPVSSPPPQAPQTFEGLIQVLQSIAAAIGKKVQVNLITNTGTGAGSLYYVDFGPGNLKVCFGRSTALTPGGAGGQAAFTVNLPAIYTALPQPMGFPGELTIQGDQQVFEAAAPTTAVLTFALRQATAGVGATGKVIWYCLGI